MLFPLLPNFIRCSSGIICFCLFHNFCAQDHEEVKPTEQLEDLFM